MFRRDLWPIQLRLYSVVTFPLKFRDVLSSDQVFLPHLDIEMQVWIARKTSLKYCFKEQHLLLCN